VVHDAVVDLLVGEVGLVVGDSFHQLKYLGARLAPDRRGREIGE
jgi:hypothetical protein